MECDSLHTTNVGLKTHNTPAQVEQLRANSRMLAAKLREADARAETAENACRGGEDQVGELQAEVDSLQRAVAESATRHGEVVAVLQAEIAELRAVEGKLPEKGQAATPEGNLNFRATLYTPPPPIRAPPPPLCAVVSRSLYGNLHHVCIHQIREIPF